MESRQVGVKGTYAPFLPYLLCESVSGAMKYGVPVVEGTGGEGTGRGEGIGGVREREREEKVMRE